MGKGRTGTSMNIEANPRKRKAAARYRRREEARWAAKSGPVIVRKVDDTKPENTS